MEVDTPLEPTLQSVLDTKTLKWIFVGGKGGVGKTTTSCCLAIMLSQVRENVLLISTDPAHNLSDALGQKFNGNPNLVNGFPNLFAMEVDPKIDPEEIAMLTGGGENSFMSDITSSLPGIDEAMSFLTVIKLIQNMQFSVVVFDTAPTGHTLRLLSFPSTLDKGLGKMVQLKAKFSGLFGQMSSLFGGNMPAGSEEEMTNNLQQLKKSIEDVHREFKDSSLTTFVCVCIPEFLSLYETERLVQELAKFEIDAQNVVVNQILFPDSKQHCHLCQARKKMQSKYIEQIHALYEDFHVVEMPLLDSEIRGIDALKHFSQYLVKSYKQTLDQK